MYFLKNKFGYIYQYIQYFIHIAHYYPQGRVILTLRPSRSIKASFYIPENIFNFPTAKSFGMKIPMKVVY